MLSIEAWRLYVSPIKWVYLAGLTHACHLVDHLNWLGLYGCIFLIIWNHTSYSIVILMLRSVIVKGRNLGHMTCRWYTSLSIIDAPSESLVFIESVTLAYAIVLCWCISILNTSAILHCKCKVYFIPFRDVLIQRHVRCLLLFYGGNFCWLLLSLSSTPIAVSSYFQRGCGSQLLLHVIWRLILIVHHRSFMIFEFLGHEDWSYHFIIPFYDTIRYFVLWFSKSPSKDTLFLA